MNDLVERLTTEQAVTSERPEKTAKALKESIDRKYVHILFKLTGTEVGVQLFESYCNFDEADFENGKGNVTLVGGLTLNYDKVKCTAILDLSTCEGTGFLELVDEAEYLKILEPWTV